MVEFIFFNFLFRMRLRRRVQHIGIFLSRVAHVNWVNVPNGSHLHPLLLSQRALLVFFCFLLKAFNMEKR
jgi:hypothetical protein